MVAVLLKDPDVSSHFKSIVGELENNMDFFSKPAFQYVGIIFACACIFFHMNHVLAILALESPIDS